jgi:hypothetical protein
LRKYAYSVDVHCQLLIYDGALTTYIIPSMVVAAVRTPPTAGESDNDAQRSNPIVAVAMIVSRSGCSILSNGTVLGFEKVGIVTNP